MVPAAFLALLLQAYILGYATDQLTISSGENIAALLNVSFTPFQGNAVELIVAIIALTKCELEVVQSSHLVYSSYDGTYTVVGSVFSNLLLVTGMALIAGGLRNGVQNFSSEESQLQSALLVFACCSILFPTISYLLQSLNANVDLSHVGNTLHIFSRANSEGNNNAVETEAELTPQAEDDEKDESKIGPIAAVALLIGTTAVVGVTAEFLVSSLNGMTAEGPLSKQFVSVILLPIVGNAAEHVSAIMMAWKNKARMALDIAVGSSLTTISFVSISFIVQDGKSNWMEGVLLFALFVNLCVAFQVYPGFESTNAVNSCIG
ncbi:hypothetical protein K435DRAFT_797850 [Dendrothele bispora CBS 962.96]|uniref:Sodium/calcium exchanger membrane region domain-containing protein n=1 Tax=Dendrothele bispora (strain CBS 962.96) TaxID=1314807 RepID=A0A4S8M180_DENBC|nr:hypothetical protein K435DRAFT_797850 [Dendrothele bispora CBS 962.96]